MENRQTASTFLLVLGVVFFPYGLYCFVAPEFLAGTAGVVGSTPTGTNELRAMYGGLQAALGVLMLWAARDPRVTLAGLAAAGLVLPGLALTRLLGLAMGGDLSGYTMGALVFEVGSSAVAIPLLRARLASTGR